MPNLILEVTRGQELFQLLMEYAAEDLPAQIGAFSVGFLLVVGSLLMLLAAIGLLRLPDLPTRMHASTKAGSLGAALIMLAVAVAMPTPDVLARVVAVVAFLLLTAPVAAHVIGRAGYFVGVPLWEGTVKDDLADQYDYESHTLESGDFSDRKIEGFEKSEDKSTPEDDNSEALDSFVPEGQEKIEPPEATEEEESEEEESDEEESDEEESDEEESDEEPEDKASPKERDRGPEMIDEPSDVEDQPEEKKKDNIKTKKQPDLEEA